MAVSYALVWSKNPPSGEIFATLGTHDAAEWHKRLGFQTPLVANDVCWKKNCPSLALGASCVHTDDLARGNNIFFSVTGITDGELVKGVKYSRNSITTHCLVMRSRSGTVRTIDATHRIDKLQRHLRAPID